MAISHANVVLSWQENLMEGEMPPQWMWHLDHELELWFERVERERSEKFGSSSDDAGGSEMMKNEMAVGRR